MKWALQNTYYWSRYQLRTLPSPCRKVMVTYHGVSPENYTAYNARHISAIQFEQHLKHFSKHFQLTSVRKILDPEFKPQKPAIAISFDDGFANNFHHALPLLSKYQAPATFFVSTAALSDENFIHPACALDLMRTFSTGKQLTLAGKVFRKYGTHEAKTSDGKTAYDYLISMPLTQRNGWLRESKTTLQQLQLKAPPLFWKCMNKEQLRSISVLPGMEVQSHTHTHMNMNLLDEKEIQNEVNTSISLLEDAIQRPVDMLAHPYVYAKPHVQQVVSNCGIRFQFSGWSQPQLTDLNFPRVTIMSGASNWYNLYHINDGFNTAGF